MVGLVIKIIMIFVAYDFSYVLEKGCFIKTSSHSVDSEVVANNLRVNCSWLKTSYFPLTG